MELLRRPDERYHDLPGSPFAVDDVEVGGVRMHHVDEGDGPPVLLLPGEPSWSYLGPRADPADRRRRRVSRGGAGPRRDRPLGGIVNDGCDRPVAPEVIAAYDAPSPDERIRGS